jgi:hypothetical protein
VLTWVCIEGAEFSLHCRKPYYIIIHLNNILPSQPRYTSLGSNSIHIFDIFHMPRVTSHLILPDAKTKVWTEKEWPSSQWRLALLRSHLILDFHKRMSGIVIIHNQVFIRLLKSLKSLKYTVSPHTHTATPPSTHFENRKSETLKCTEQSSSRYSRLCWQ